MIRTIAQRMWKEDEGVLSWEWVLLTTLLVLGIVTGLTAGRDAVIDEMGDVSQALLAVDQTYTIDFPLEIVIDGETTGGATLSDYLDDAQYADCGRNVTPLGQGSQFDP